MDMTPEVLRKLCTEHELYRTPELNDKLYLNFKGFTRIANLEEYTNLKALFLEGNALETLSGLPHLKDLKCLFLQQNCIWGVAGLDNVPLLDTLNISGNQVSSLEGLGYCKDLHTLIATDNRLSSVESISALADCPKIQTLDLQNNRLDDPGVVTVIKQLSSLKCLYLAHNPVVSKIPNYRKSLIASIPTLTYLDDRPIFDVERLCAEAWAQGGLEAERDARRAYREEEQANDRRNFEYMQQLRREGWRKRRQALGLPDGDTDPLLDNMSDTEWEPVQDPPELVAAREKMAALTAAKELHCIASSGRKDYSDSVNDQGTTEVKFVVGTQNIAIDMDHSKQKSSHNSCCSVHVSDDSCNEHSMADTKVGSKIFVAEESSRSLSSIASSQIASDAKAAPLDSNALVEGGGLGNIYFEEPSKRIVSTYVSSSASVADPNQIECLFASHQLVINNDIDELD